MTVTEGEETIQQHAEKIEAENLRKEQLADHVWCQVVKYLKRDVTVTVSTFGKKPEFCFKKGIPYKRTQTTKPSRERKIIVVNDIVNSSSNDTEPRQSYWSTPWLHQYMGDLLLDKHHRPSE